MCAPRGISVLTMADSLLQQQLDEVRELLARARRCSAAIPSHRRIRSRPSRNCRNSRARFAARRQPSRRSRCRSNASTAVSRSSRVGTSADGACPFCTMSSRTRTSALR